MNVTFVDTSFLIALVRRKDQWHSAAVAWNGAMAGTLMTTEYVLVEFVDALVQTRLRPIAVRTVRILRERPSMHVVPASTNLLDAGLEFFGRHADKLWSLTDCISFVLMRQENVQEALSSDHDFEQAGFRALLRSDPPGR